MLVLESAKVNLPQVGTSQQTIPYHSAACQKAYSALRLPMGLVHPRSKMTHMGFLARSTTVTPSQAEACRDHHLKLLAAVFHKAG